MASFPPGFIDKQQSLTILPSLGHRSAITRPSLTATIKFGVQALQPILLRASTDCRVQPPAKSEARSDQDQITKILSDAEDSLE